MTMGSISQSSMESSESLLVRVDFFLWNVLGVVMVLFRARNHSLEVR